jgi:hypothetical protein
MRRNLTTEAIKRLMFVKHVSFALPLLEWQLIINALAKDQLMFLDRVRKKVHMTKDNNAKTVQNQSA